MTPHSLTAFLSVHGLWILAPAALVEGPLVTVIAGALAAQGLLALPAVIAVATLADLAGDAALWLVGRKLRHRLPRRLQRAVIRRIPPQRLRRNAGRILMFGKLTHSAGALVLLAAGMARVPFWPFLGFNLTATLPKVVALAAFGWVFGLTVTASKSWLAVLPAVLLLFALGSAALWLRLQGKPRCASHA